MAREGEEEDPPRGSQDHRRVEHGQIEAFRLKQIDYEGTNVNYNFNVCMCYIAYNILSRPMQNVSYVSEVL